MLQFLERALALLCVAFAGFGGTRLFGGYSFDKLRFTSKPACVVHRSSTALEPGAGDRGPSPKELGEEPRLPDGDELTLKVQRRIGRDDATRTARAIAEPANGHRQEGAGYYWVAPRRLKPGGWLNCEAYVGGMMSVRLPPGCIPAIPSSQPLTT